MWLYQCPSPAKFCDEHDLTYPLLRGLQKKIMCPRSHCSSPKQGNQGWQRRLPTPIVLTWSWACTGGGPFPHPPRTRFHTHHRRGTPPSPARRREASLHSMASQFLILSGSNVDTVSPEPRQPAGLWVSQFRPGEKLQCPFGSEQSPETRGYAASPLSLRGVNAHSPSEGEHPPCSDLSPLCLTGWPHRRPTQSRDFYFPSDTVLKKEALGTHTTSKLTCMSWGSG